MSLRVAFYSHNGFGLGHVGRNLKIARALLKVRPNADVLIITGASGLDGMAVPAGVDYVKLPTVRKQGTGRWRPQSLDIPMEQLQHLRQMMILETVRAYRPHLFVADFLPLGVDGELTPALEELAARPDARSVIGFRDILDDPAVVRSAWQGERVYDVFDSLYDGVLVYGEPSWFDFASYGIRPEVPRYVGLLGDLPNGIRPRRASSFKILATCGGGGDGYAVLAAALEAAELLRGEVDVPVRCSAVTGPLMSEFDAARLQEIAKRTGGRVRRFEDDFRRKVAQASVVVGMAGYNTVCEVLSHRRPAVFVPRYGPSEEQPIRADILTGRGLAQNVPLAKCTSDTLANAIAKLASEPAYPEDALPELGGLSNTVDALLSLL
jgi:predicted glycosyltransferase